MKIAYTTTAPAHDIHHWSGTPFHMSRAFAANGVDVTYIDSLKRKLPPFFKVKQTWTKWVCRQRISPRFNEVSAKYYSEQVAQKIAHLKCDAIVSPLINPISHLDCDIPIVLWTDALYAGLLGFYAPFSYHSAETIAQANKMTVACLSRCSLAIFCSDWAANSAIELYGVDRHKIHVVPFGANLEDAPTFADVKTFIQHRARKKIKLLFLAKSWERKGGDTVLAVAKALYEAGHPVELTITGYLPPHLHPVPPYVKITGFLSKHDPAGKQQLRQLLADTHFLFVPSRAEAYGIVFCEANAFGVPCLTTYTGGIGTVVKDHINGMTFSLHAPINSYCDYIVNVMQNYHDYESLALSSYQTFATRLNWQTGTTQVKKLIHSLS
ncbi:MAG TPA: glycosyltransferase family 4 protein [Gammaproteobacteria bacterium]|jgi:glycosyltransferase involved in cell wall biosynthesis|nr:glycosyltransferase family 4 protein [Gammaproteobacteria bacterium]